MGSITTLTNSLMYLKHKIDPTTPSFLDLNLSFLRAVKNSMPDRAMCSTMFFIHYLLGDSKLYGLKSLVNFVVQIRQKHTYHIFLHILPVLSKKYTILKYNHSYSDLKQANNKRSHYLCGCETLELWAICIRNCNIES